MNDILDIMIDLIVAAILTAILLTVFYYTTYITTETLEKRKHKKTLFDTRIVSREITDIYTLIRYVKLMDIDNSQFQDMYDNIVSIDMNSIMNDYDITKNIYVKSYEYNQTKLQYDIIVSINNTNDPLDTIKATTKLKNVADMEFIDTISSTLGGDVILEKLGLFVMNELNDRLNKLKLDSRYNEVIKGVKYGK